MKIIVIFDVEYLINLMKYFSEYIVVFKNYYKASTRNRFITSAVKKSTIISWKIVPRNNAASDFPSDFDVIEVSLLCKY